MAKVWKDASEVVKVVDVPKELDAFESIMKEIPNHKRDNSKVVYRRKNFIILSTGSGFVVHNKDYKFDDAHTHTNNFNYAKSLIDLSIRKKLPNRPNRRTIESLIRINRDRKYIAELERVLFQC